MTLRAKIVAYFAVLHLIVAALAVLFLREQPKLLFAAEALFVISVFVSFRLVRALFVPLDLIRTGAELMGERDFSSTFVPVGQPELDRLIAIYNTMIEKLREERLAAQEQQQLLQQIVQASPAGIVICDFDGKVQQMNPAAKRLLGDELPDVPPGESRVMTIGGSRRVKATRAEFRDRGFARSFYLIEELTEELRLSEKAAYEKLIRMMSHEVNNSVAAVRSLLESLLRYAPQVHDGDREDFSGAVTIASARMESLNAFMRGFADVIRIPPPRKVPVRLDDIARQIAALVRPDLTLRNIELRTTLDEVTIDGDAGQLEQVLLNVVKNAADAIGSSGVIQITLTPRRLSVADSGEGIAESHRAELFTPFFTTRREGRGLGLTIVQEIVSNHGFRFALENRPAGGAEFTMWLGAESAVLKESSSA